MVGGDSEERVPLVQRRRTRSLWIIVTLVVLTLTSPDEASFSQYLAGSPKSMLDHLSYRNLVTQGMVAVGLEKRAFVNLLLVSFGSREQDFYLGILGKWISVPGIGSFMCPFVEWMSSLEPSDWVNDDVYFYALVMGGIYLLWQFLDETTMRDHFVLTEHSILRRPWTIVTAPLSHAELSHLAMNLFSFLAVGPAMRASLGHTSFLHLFGGGALCSVALSVVLVKLLSKTYIEALGCSGGLYALFFFAALQRPDQLVEMFFFSALGAPALKLSHLVLVQLGLEMVLSWGSWNSWFIHLLGALYGLVFFEVQRKQPTSVGEFLSDLGGGLASFVQGAMDFSVYREGAGESEGMQGPGGMRVQESYFYQQAYATR
uniref:Peptidase S54 rhomboid domain-containing protein n=1 Tax=Chromera velia CCMP2878 TaxID=1169474 RepID=A0A0G4HZX7_9ALVE|mmetsp:Transcript_34841/g.68788  ORF Transcript_34841/g.68788 Transcript_34841/m.68788 type:complete len:373 (-) Transcript_34841:159-1277(-)|eukprot:Cvel_9794.t1-p1 / transcript=Cvel_9794.t1 / gene=Cvel_9794 / organism=Chromera_velia_CCMP2878 / gene_product=hypothetical protein / transcript_product=hypothetical protein / location=Cvel_scaffold574:74382-76710(-) / protein_length=372 / sequence_SO=supercontig / SO=protein_coding / is_pseudo=false